MAKKKISRKELLKTEDEFITRSTRLLQFIIAHKLQISYAIGGLLALVILFSGYRYISVKGENKATALMDQGVKKYQTALAADGAVKAYQAVQDDFKLLLEKYAGKKSGKLARITFANMCLDAGEYDRAIALFQRALEDFAEDLSLKGLILSGLAYAHAGKKDFSSALAYFENIVADPEAILKDEALFNLARIYETLGKTDKSREVYTKIVKEYKNSIYFAMAEEKLAG